MKKEKDGYKIMNKDIIKKSKTWREVKGECNFSKEDLEYIRGGVRLYDLLASFREEKDKRSSLFCNPLRPN